jgi:hypothetical protein
MEQKSAFTPDIAANELDESQVAHKLFLPLLIT